MRSIWLDEALPGEEEAPPLEGDERADVCIVGGGYTGLWTALRLKEQDPALEITLLEADVCGGGPSGRNGGFVLSWWAKFGTLVKLCGADEARRLARRSAEAVAEIGDFCAEHGIDADFRPEGWLWTATSPAQVGAWDAVVDELERYGERPFEHLGPEEVARLAGSDRHLAGVFESTAASVQPALLARGLRRVALERGVRIFERSPVRGLERGRPARLRTGAGSVTAERIVLATGAWLVQTRALRRALVAVSSDMVATAPTSLGLGGLAVSDSRLRVHYYRLTRDGRLAFGKGGGTIAFDGRIGSAFHGPSPRAGEVEAALRATYPQLGSVPVTASWTGPIDRSLNGLPFFHRLREDVVAGAGYSGNGVGPSYLGGRILASLTLGLDDEWARAGFVGPPRGAFPPEPLRFAGGLLVREAVTAKERAEDEGRAPSRLALWIARLAPAGLVPLKSRT
jgi:putative aminophosphonate oxidoreductase